MKKTVIIALGGNALSPKEEAGTINQQFRHTRDTLKSVMHFVNLDYNICITHGNGPQVGAELSKNEIAMDIIPPLPTYPSLRGNSTNLPLSLVCHNFGKEGCTLL